MLNAYQTAVELEPEFIEYRLGLLAFYLEAPAIVGGSLEKAYIEAETISSLDEIQGVLAFAHIHQKNQDEESLYQLYNQALVEFPNNIEILYSPRPQATAEAQAHWKL